MSNLILLKTLPNELINNICKYISDIIVERNNKWMIKITKNCLNTFFPLYEMILKPTIFVNQKQTIISTWVRFIKNNNYFELYYTTGVNKTEHLYYFCFNTEQHYITYNNCNNTYYRLSDFPVKNYYNYFIEYKNPIHRKYYKSRIKT